MTPAPIEAVVVVVPVHDEAALLDRCLSSLQAAVAAADVRCEVRIVLDACTDGSAAIAARHPFVTVATARSAVGSARAAGVASALETLHHIPPPQIWIANTDADSAVPPDWLRVQLDLAAEGADVILGTVRPDFADLTAAHRRLWLATHASGSATGNVHGANLGVRAGVYVDAGGFSAVTEHEDVLLVEACRRGGAAIVATAAAEVLTSGRLVGRTPGGYAGFLRAQDRRLRGGREREDLDGDAA